MEQHFLKYKDSLISYLRFGTGPKTALCFDGFGEDGNSYSFLEDLAGKEFTFIAIDLPFHGKTNWKAGENFLQTDLESIIKNILSENNLLNLESTPSFTLLGFSLGGRIALSLYEVMPGQIEKIVLLAPDGLMINFWYWLSTQTWAGNWLFSFTMKHPRWFFGFLKFINALGLINASLFKFVTYYIVNKDARSLLFLRWMSLRKVKPDLKKIKSFIRENKTRITLVYGKHDRIILPARGKKFRKGIEDYSSLIIINSGHQILHEKYADELLSLLIGKYGNP